MAGIPPLPNISQQHNSIYENYFQQVNPSGSGKVQASDAANFLKKSGLPDATLHTIWAQADIGSKGFLDKQGFYVALKLIALSQSSQECHVKNLALATPPPNMGDSPRAAVGVAKSNNSDNWCIGPNDKKQYDGIFDGLKPVNGLLTGDKVKPVLLNSKLPVDILGKVWELSDIDKDGSLDRDEFSVAMFLVYRALAGETIPPVLPLQLIPLAKRDNKGLLKTTTPAAASTSAVLAPIDSVFPSISAPQRSNWVVQPAEKSQYDVMFKKVDMDADGLVSGGEIKDILIASGLPQNSLAHIWNLCDINNTGQLNSDQFALAMYLLKFAKSGKDLPTSLTPEMIPPSSRVQSHDELSAVKFESTSNDFSAIKELDKITTEIEALGKEKSQLQREITETEEAIRNRRSEIEKLQTELEKANKGLDVLAEKKKSSQYSLDALQTEHDKYLALVTDIKEKCKDEEQNVKQMRTQLSSQESSNKEQEQELFKARKELDDLKREESDLESRIEKNKKHLDSMKTKTAAAKSEILQSQGRIDKLSDENSKIKDEIKQITNAENGLSTLNDASNFDARFKDVDQISQISARATAGSSPVSSISGFSVSSKDVDDDFKDSDPFKGKSDPFGSNTDTDPFNSDDPFKSDPFKSVSFAEDPFAGDPFQGSTNSGGDDDPFKSDPFKTSDSHNDPVSAGSDPFGTIDPFGGSGGFSIDTNSNKSDFASPANSVHSPTSKSDASDPFGSSHNVFTTSDASKDKPLSGDPFASSDPFTSSDPFAATSSGKASVTTGDNLFAATTASSFNKASPKTSTSIDDPFASSSTNAIIDPFASNTKSDDPFASATTSNDPFASATIITSSQDPFSSSSNDPFTSAGNKDDPFSTGGSAPSDSNDAWFAFSENTSKTTPSVQKKDSVKKQKDFSEAGQLAWAKNESKRAEENRLNRMKELAKKEELEIALAIKQSVESSSDA